MVSPSQAFRKRGKQPLSMFYRLIKAMKKRSVLKVIQDNSEVQKKIETTINIRSRWKNFASL